MSHGNDIIRGILIQSGNLIPALSVGLHITAGPGAVRPYIYPYPRRSRDLGSIFDIDDAPDHRAFVQDKINIHGISAGHVNQGCRVLIKCQSVILNGIIRGIDRCNIIIPDWQIADEICTGIIGCCGSLFFSGRGNGPCNDLGS